MPSWLSSKHGGKNDLAVEVHSVLGTAIFSTSNAMPSNKEHANPPASENNSALFPLHKFEGVETASPASGINKRKPEGCERIETAGTGSAIKKRKTEGCEGNQPADPGSDSKKRETEGSEGNKKAGVGSDSIKENPERNQGNEVAGAGLASNKRNAEGVEGNETSCSGSAAKRKRRLWTEEEDTKLIAAVQSCGEGNWVTILKGHLWNGRTASQLSKVSASSYLFLVCLILGN